MSPPTRAVALHVLAHARTGDKGNRCNISVIAYRADDFATLVAQVTEQRVAELFAHRRPSGVQRYLLPNLAAMNFVIDDVLDGGVNGALNLDAHGKSLAFLLLGIPITVAVPEPQPPPGEDMNLTRRLASGAALALAATAALAQQFPTKPITFVVPFAAGSATDQIARAIGQGVSDQAGQSVVVENKPGASGFLAAQQVAKAPADGYTVLITTNTTHAANEHLYKSLPYDPVKDFSPVTLLGKGGQIMIVNPKVEAKSVAEFIALAKKQPGKLTYGSGSSSSRIAGELLQQMAGIELLHVPYKSNPLAVTDLLGGQIDMMITDSATGLPQVKAGKVRALGVTAPKRSPLAPDVPTIDEAGVKGYEMGYWFAAYVPARTPPAVVKRLNELIVAATKRPGAVRFYESTGTDPVVSTPEELAKFQLAESAKWGRIVRAANITPE